MTKNMEKIQTNDVSCDIDKQQHEPFSKEKIEDAIKEAEDVLLAKWSYSSLLNPEEPFLKLSDYGYDVNVIRYRRNNDITSAIASQYCEMEENKPFLVANNYHAIVKKRLPNGRYKHTMQEFKAGVLKAHFEKEDIDNMPKFKTSTFVYDFLNYQQIDGECFNRAYPPTFRATDVYDVLSDQKDNVFKEDSTEPIRHCLQLVHHIFGEQWSQGLRYLALLVQRPYQSLPVLCLASKENATGKSTFVKLLRMMLGDCVGFYDETHLNSQFNNYATSHVIAFEEIYNAKGAVNKIKAMATCSTLPLNEKGKPVEQVEVAPHIIINTNNETDFITANQYDIRYWAIKVRPLKGAYATISSNREELDKVSDFDKQLMKEAKAFFAFLLTFPHIGEKKSRMWFAENEIRTSLLKAIRESSKSELAKNLQIKFTEFIQRYGNFYATIDDLKTYFCIKEGEDAIKQVLQKEFGMKAMKVMKYVPVQNLAHGANTRVTGRPYYFTDDQFKDKED